MPTLPSLQDSQQTRICLEELEQLIDSYEKVLDKNQVIEQLLEAIEQIHGEKPQVYDVLSYGLLLILLGLKAYNQHLQETGMSEKEANEYIDTMIICISYLARRLASP